MRPYCVTFLGFYVSTQIYGSCCFCRILDSYWADQVVMDKANNALLAKLVTGEILQKVPNHPNSSLISCCVGIILHCAYFISVIEILCMYTGFVII